MAKHSGEMIKEAMKKKGLTQIELAKMIGRDQTLLSRYINGQIEVSDATARAITEKLGIEFEDIRRQLQRDRFERRRGNLATEFEEVIKNEREIDLSASTEITDIARVGVEEVVSIPIFDYVPTNYKELKNEAEMYILPHDVHVDPDNSFAIKVTENDITDDKIDQGDIIIIDTSAKVKDKDRALAILNGKPILRRIYYMGDNIVLQSTKSNEPFQPISKGDVFKIIGRLSGCIKHF